MIEGLQNCITFMCLYLPIQACESLMRHIVVCAQSVRIEKYQCVCHCNITTQSYGAHKRCHFVKMMTLFVTPVSRCTVGVDGQKVRHSKALELRNRSYNTDLKSPYLKSRDAGSNPNDVHSDTKRVHHCCASFSLLWHTMSHHRFSKDRPVYCASLNRSKY